MAQIPDGLVGSSLSLCVADIADGLVPIEKVDRIIAGTTATSPEKWAKVFAEYRKGPWVSNPDKAERIARELINNEKVFQPRLSGVGGPDTSEGYWRDAKGKFFDPRAENAALQTKTTGQILDALNITQNTNGRGRAGGPGPKRGGNPIT